MTDGEVFNGPRPIAHGWYATAYDGAVHEVWQFGDDSLYVLVNGDGRIVLRGSGDPTYSGMQPTRSEAITRVLETADNELTRARAAVDSLRAELASAG